jgi:hypothetical protein
VLKPALIFVNDGDAYCRAIELVNPDCPVVAARNAQEIPGALALPQLYKSESPAVMHAFARLDGDTPARYLMTSGSTGAPKAVVHTHGMLCANQQAIAQCWRFLEHEELIVLDWLPWSHVFGANHNFNLVLRNGGTLYIDDGLPLPGQIDRTVENLKSVRPTLYFNVPRGPRCCCRTSSATRAGACPVRTPAHAVLRRCRAAPEQLGAAVGVPPRCAIRRCSLPPSGARPRRRRWSPACISPLTRPASSACRCRARSSSSCPAATSWRCACAVRRCSRVT